MSDEIMPGVLLASAGKQVGKRQVAAFDALAVGSTESEHNPGMPPKGAGVTFVAGSSRIATP